MNSPIAGLHHVTAVASDPQQNINFYSGLLGLRLVKKTVNFDDPSAYHLYYGDETGTPGTIITFFYWPGLEAKGRVGAGQMTALTFSAPTTSLGFWGDRLVRHGIRVARLSRFGEQVLSFADPDGIPVEIVAVDGDQRKGWPTAWVCERNALRGMLTAVLTIRDATASEQVLSGVMGFRLVHREGNRARFETGPGGPGRYVDVIVDPQADVGRPGSGTIHHIAFRVPDDSAQKSVLRTLQREITGVSSVRDRSYFRSVYFREPGGILFEVATDVPGFAIDEPVATLGASLKLPPQFEVHRAEIESLLPELHEARSYV